MFKRLGGKKEYQKEYMKEYQELNKDKLIEYKKEYRESNKDNIARNRKEYYNDNKEKLKEKHECECGGKYTHGNKKHIQYTEQQNEEV